MNIGAMHSYPSASTFTFGQNRYTKEALDIQENQKEEDRKSILATDLAMNKQGDTLLESLKEQYRSYQEDLNSLSENAELTPEEKLEKRKELREQMESVADQISARQLQLQEQQKDKVEEEQKKRQDELKHQNKGEEEYKNQKHQEFLTETSLLMTEVHTLVKVRSKVKGEFGVATAELEVSMARPGEVSEGLHRRVSDTRKRLSSVELTYSDKLGKLNKTVEEEKEQVEVMKSLEQKKKEEEKGKNQVLMQHVDIFL